MYQPLHLFLRQTIAGHDLKEQRFIIVRDVAQMRSQAMEAVVALALDRLASCLAEPLGDDV